MPEFQKTIDLTLANHNNSYAYLDFKLIVTKESLEVHKKALQRVIQKLDDEHLAVSLDKC